MISIIYEKVIVLLCSSRNHLTFIFYLKNIFKNKRDIPSDKVNTRKTYIIKQSEEIHFFK